MKLICWLNSIRRSFATNRRRAVCSPISRQLAGADGRSLGPTLRLGHATVRNRPYPPHPVGFQLDLNTTNWDEYNKQIGGAMEFYGMTRNQLQWLQVRAYLAVYLRNWRFWDLDKFVWEFRSGA